MQEQIVYAVSTGIIELFNRHAIFYRKKVEGLPAKYFLQLIGKHKNKRVITICLINQRNQYMLEVLLHNTARKLNGRLGYQQGSEASEIDKLERIIKPVYININEPDTFAIIERLIVKSLSMH